MKPFIIILTIIFVFFIFSIQAKPVVGTTIDNACKQSQIIIIAKIVKHQYECIGQELSIEVDKFSLWSEYQIIRIIKNNNKNKLISKNSIVRVANKSNSCLRWTTKVTRKGKNLEFLNLNRNKQNEISVLPLANFTTNRKSKIILFLNEVTTPNQLKPLDTINNIPAENYKFEHFGWFISPTTYSNDTLQNIQELVRNKQK